jgi:hypothetical protein
LRELRERGLDAVHELFAASGVAGEDDVFFDEVQF